jgi:xanthosine phosphorylase
LVEEKQEKHMTKALDDAMLVIRKYAPNFQAKVGMILGSGLANLSDEILNPITIPYQAFGLTSGSIQGHASLLVLGHLNDIPIVCMKGRLHMYEGVPYEALCILVRVVRNLGARTLITTASAGSLLPEVGPGELMMITDHINNLPGNPLVGLNDESIGPRFVSMANAYNSDLNEVMRQSAKKLNIPLHEGVYISTLGPSFETPAEIRAFKTLGADAVGMSVVPEVIIARHCGLQVVGLLAITNLAEGLSDEKLTHENTLANGAICARKLSKLIPEFVKEESQKIAI